MFFPIIVKIAACKLLLLLLLLFKMQCVRVIDWQSVVCMFEYEFRVQFKWMIAISD